MTAREEFALGSVIYSHWLDITAISQHSFFTSGGAINEHQMMLQLVGVLRENKTPKWQLEFFQQFVETESRGLSEFHLESLTKLNIWQAIWEQPEPQKAALPLLANSFVLKALGPKRILDILCDGIDKSPQAAEEVIKTWGAENLNHLIFSGLKPHNSPEVAAKLLAFDGAMNELMPSHLSRRLSQAFEVDPITTAVIVLMPKAEIIINKLGPESAHEFYMGIGDRLKGLEHKLFTPTMRHDLSQRFQAIVDPAAGSQRNPISFRTTGAQRTNSRNHFTPGFG